MRCSKWKQQRRGSGAATSGSREDGVVLQQVGAAKQITVVVQQVKAAEMMQWCCSNRVKQ